MSKPPKRENIEVPADVNPKTYQREVIKRAKKGLSGHSWSMWGSQVASMATTHVDLSGLKGIPVTYFACISSKNDTIVQPLAADRGRAPSPG